MKHLNLTFLLLTFLLPQTLFAQKQNTNHTVNLSEKTGPYLGQKLAGTSAKLFAPGIIATGLYTRDIAITPDGKEVYYCISSMGYNLIFYTKQVDGKWTEPALAPFISKFKYMHYEPCILPGR